MSRRSNKSAMRSRKVAPKKLLMLDNKVTDLPKGRHHKTVTVSKDYNKAINTSISAIPSAQIHGLFVYSKGLTAKWTRSK